MPTLPRLRLLAFPAARRESTPPKPDADPYAGWFVAAAWVGTAVLVFGFVARYAARVPVFDEFCHLEILLGDPSYWLRGLFWQHNEHRLPLPRAVYFALMKATGFDFKAPCYFNAGCLSLATLGLLAAVRRARGHFVYADAFVPLVVMSPGQWENLLWGFQVQFVLSTTLVFGFAALVIDPRFPTSTRRVALAGFAGVSLMLCGANGVAFGPALALFLGWLGVRGLRQRTSDIRRPAVVALVGAVLIAAVVPAYFLTLTKAEHHPPAGLLAAAKGTAEMFALTLGPVGRLAEGPEASGWPTLGVVVLSLLLPTAALVLWRLRDPERRVRAAGLAAVALGVCCLAAGVGYGRAGVGPVLAVNRYVTLMLPLAVVVYLAWALLAPPNLGRATATGLLVAAAVCVWPNATEGNRVGAVRAAQLARCELEIRAGVPLTYFADRHRDLYPGSREQLLKHLRTLKEQRIGVFTRLADDPQVIETEVPLSVSHSEGFTVDGNRIYGDRFAVGATHIVFALPRKMAVYGLRLEYELGALPGVEHNRLTFFSGGERAGRFGSHDRALAWSREPQTVHVLVDDTIDSFRLDLPQTYQTLLTIRRITLLTRP